MSIDHPLYKLLKTQGRDFGEFAKSIGLSSEKSLYRYFSGERRPGREQMPLIEKETNGEISASIFFGGVQ